LGGHHGNGHVGTAGLVPSPLGFGLG
jgi:hypothetical protein